MHAWTITFVSLVGLEGAWPTASLSPPPLWRVGVVAPRAHRHTDRHADEAEGLAQAVDEVALVALGNLVDRIAEQHEERRARLGLRHVTDLDPAPGDGRRGRRV